MTGSSVYARSLAGGAVVMIGGTNESEGQGVTTISTELAVELSNTTCVHIFPVQEIQTPKKDLENSHWEDISTLPELFEISCKNHSDMFFLDIRRLIAREIETSEDGKIGHKSEERVAIFADTREEWFITLQGCFRRKVTVLLSIHLWERKLFVTRSMRYVHCVHDNPQTRNRELQRFYRRNTLPF
ncbi:unnamed protein product [Brassica oleracea var. botrytis]|uniref:Uncharacterized protein n=3 Tax=Brassica TaxID=3705 RepID=A0A0D3D4C4_BRAOL|nr:unnamed protein product [Brassica napus]CDY68023.1 BnaCnng57330D [Brassica napus]VDD35802.1 unnamed protein product [Brassica oleracea]